ncbi:MAG: YdbL family protein [Xanthomonadales bacterium]|nr:YdbL family protein [Xanthomonadales bacterium]
MKKLTAALFLCTSLVLAACVTINVYFPAAAAERAAEQFVGDVLGEPREDGSLFGPPTRERGVLWAGASGLLDLLVLSAHAQEPEIEINTPQINAIKARMAERQRMTLNAFFDAGAIGFTRDGLVAVRDRSAVSLSERRKLESAVADENRDRRAVYREIAVANGHPEWEQKIQETFAREWVNNARPGWHYQDSGGTWRRK